MIRLPAILQHWVWVCAELFTNTGPSAFAFVALMFAKVMLCIMDTGLSVHKDPSNSHLPQWLIDWPMYWDLWRFSWTNHLSFDVGVILRCVLYDVWKVVFCDSKRLSITAKGLQASLLSLKLIWKRGTVLSSDMICFLSMVGNEHANTMRAKRLFVTIFLKMKRICELHPSFAPWRADLPSRFPGQCHAFATTTLPSLLTFMTFCFTF